MQRQRARFGPTPTMTSVPACEKDESRSTTSGLLVVRVTSLRQACSARLGVPGAELPALLGPPGACPTASQRNGGQSQYPEPCRFDHLVLSCLRMSACLTEMPPLDASRLLRRAPREAPPSPLPCAERHGRAHARPPREPPSSRAFHREKASPRGFGARSIPVWRGVFVFQHRGREAVAEVIASGAAVRPAGGTATAGAGGGRRIPSKPKNIGVTEGTTRSACRCTFSAVPDLIAPTGVADR